MVNKILFRFTLFTAFCTAILIFIGGLVTSTGSGLSVPDWPTTFGENMFTYPIHKWTGGVQFEHGHRLFASFVGLLVIGTVLLMRKYEERKWVRILSYYALFIVILQGIFGGVTVLLKLPPAVSILHGMLAQSFFCLIAALAYLTSPAWRNPEPINSEAANQFRRIGILMTTAVFLQLFFGALLRHTYSGLAIPDFPLAYGQFFPSLDAQDVQSYNQLLIEMGYKHAADRPLMVYQIVVNLLHRYWAVVVFVTLVSGSYIFLKNSISRSIKKFGWILLSLVFIQFSLGIITVLTQKQYIVTSFHVVFGAIVLMTCALSIIHSIHSGKQKVS